MFASKGDVLEELLNVARYSRMLSRFVKELWSRGLEWQALMVAVVGGIAIMIAAWQGARLAKHERISAHLKQQESEKHTKNIGPLTAPPWSPLAGDDNVEPYHALAELLEATRSYADRRAVG